jgi:hypothetical protein
VQQCTLGVPIFLALHFRRNQIGLAHDEKEKKQA